MKKSLLAGILVGLGVIINLQIEQKIIGALLFSFGLLTIINMQLPLYTGKIGFLVKNLPMILCGNLIGIALTVGLYSLGNQNFENIIFTASTIKFSKSILTLFINAFFCGMLIHFAVKNKIIILTIFSVMIFILIGAEHCIADFPYYLYNINLYNTFKFISIILGNSLGAILIERLSD